jgi:cell division protein FtsI/penicillin-binding protein 2
MTARWRRASAAFALVFLSSCGGTDDRPGGSYYAYTPVGYNEMADAMIKADSPLIHYDCEQNRIESRLLPDTPEYDWFENSYLEDDISRFNARTRGYESLFVIEGCSLLGVNRYAHVVPLPNATSPLWLGDLAYHNRDVVGSVRGDGLMVSILAPSHRPLAAEHESVPVRVDERRGSTQVPRTAVVARFHAPAGESVGIADLHAVGSHTVLRDRRDAGSLSNIDVLITGRKVPPDRVARLEDGDWIQFVERARDTVVRDTFLYSSRDLGATISSSGVRNGTPARLEPAPNSLGFVPQLIAAMNTAVRSAADDGVSVAGRFDIELSVEIEAQERLTASLEQFVERQLPDRGRPRRAGVTVLDLFSGEVIALASYPSQETDIDRFSFLSRNERERLALNQNFAIHPIGSAGKPFWTSAVLSLYPYLAGFTVPAHEANDEYPTLLGRTLRQGYEIHSHPGTRVDVVRAIEESSNKFIVDLTTVSLAAKEETRGRERLTGLQDAFEFTAAALPPGDQFEICGQPAPAAPEARFHWRDPDTLVQLDQNPLFRTFAAITGVKTSGEGAVERELRGSTTDPIWRLYSASRYHLAPWQILLREFDGEDVSAERSALLRQSFGAASPQAVNLAVNRIDDTRGEWISLLLGGGNALWNNLQLAEATARLVTGRAVRSNLLSSLRADEIAAPGLESAGTIGELDERARRLVLHGMERVVSGAAGTGRPARALGQRLRRELPDHRIFLFGKTGTPRVEVPAYTPLSRAVGTLVNEAGLLYDAGSSTLRETAVGRQLLSEMPVSLRQAVRALIDDFNADTEQARLDRGTGSAQRLLYVDAEGRLRANVASPNLVHSQAGVFVLAILAVPNDDVTPNESTPPCVPPEIGAAVRRIPLATELSARAFGLSLAVHIDDVPGNAEETAVRFLAGNEDAVVDILKSRQRSVQRP